MSRTRLRMGALPLCLLAALALLAACGQSPPAATPAPTSPPAATAAPTSPPAATAAPQPTAAASGSGAEPPYIDNRSDGALLIQSLYSAINRHEYLRAYSYWEPSSPDLQPYPRFKQGYASTSAVTPTLGTIGSSAGAGQTYLTVPVTLAATSSDGGQQTFVGCYVLHLGSPIDQATPPFQPLAIQAAKIQPLGAGASAADQLAQACQGSDIPSTTPLAPAPPFDPTNIAQSAYLDDRSDPAQVVRSLYNAINRREYLRAYAYWQSGAPLPPFPQFQQGYSATLSVDLTLGPASSDAGAGQLRERLPVTLRARTNSGPQTFVGCYQLHLAQPAVQDAPPFQPWAIEAASVKPVADAESAAQLATICQSLGE